MALISLLLAYGLMIVVMIAAWTAQRVSGNTGWVDVVWTFGTGAVAGGFALMSASDNAPVWRHVVVAGIVVIWSLRLGGHIALRVWHDEREDARYLELKKEWGSTYQGRLFWFLQAQAVVSAILVLAVTVAARNPAPSVTVGDVVGPLLLLLSVAGEGLADRQLLAFRRQPENRGRLCDAGLWRWSRHPNYFFEWLAWIAYPVIAINFSGVWPAGWLALGAPLVMYAVLVYASGIPPLEQHMAASRGAAFERYRARTSRFFPWPPRTGDTVS